MRNPAEVGGESPRQPARSTLNLRGFREVYGVPLMQKGQGKGQKRSCGSEFAIKDMHNLAFTRITAARFKDNQKAALWDGSVFIPYG